MCRNYTLSEVKTQEGSWPISGSWIFGTISIGREKVGEVFQILGHGERQAAHYAREALGLPQLCPLFAGRASVFIAESSH